AAQERLMNWPEIAKQALKNERVQGAAPFVSAQAMVLRGDRLRGVQVRGIDPKVEAEVSDLQKQMLDDGLAQLTSEGYGIVLGVQLAHVLGVQVGDNLMLMAAEGGVSPAGFSPRMRQFTVTGLYSSGHYEYDSSLVFINYEDALRLFRQQAQSGLRLRIDDIKQALDVTRTLQQEIFTYCVLSDCPISTKMLYAVEL